MAGDFKEVGVKVVVQGASKFRTDLESVKKAFTKFTENISESIGQLELLAALSAQVASSFGAINTAANLSAVTLRNATNAANSTSASLQMAARNARMANDSSLRMARTVGYAGRAWRDMKEGVTLSAGELTELLGRQGSYIANTNRLRVTLTEGQTAFANLGRATTHYKTSLDTMSAGMQRTITYFDFLSRKLVAVRGESLSLSENALVKISMRSDTVAKSIINLNSQYDKSSAELAQNEAKQKQLYGEMDKTNRSLTQMSERLIKVDSEMVKYKRRNETVTREVARLNYEVRHVESALETLRGTSKKTEQDEKRLVDRVNSLRLALDKKGNEMLETREAINFLTVEEQKLRNSIDLSNKELTESIPIYSALRSRADLLAQELEQLRQQMNLMRNTGGLLGGGLKTSLAAGFQIAKAGAEKFIAVMRTAINVMKTPITIIQNLGARIADFGGRLRFMGDKMFRQANAIRFYGQSLLFFLSLPIVGAIKSWTSAAIDFESAFAGVVKTVDEANFRVIEEGSTNINDLTEEGKRLRQAFIDLSNTIPISAIELAEIGQIAGQLGIRGVSNIMSFTEVIARLGVSTNLSTDEAANGLARLLAIMVGPDIVNNPQAFANVIESLGGSLVDLGNKLPTTEQSILKFAVRIAATGKVAGLSADQVLGIGAAFTAVGVPAERGGTAVQKVLIRMIQTAEEGGIKLEALAATAGLTVNEFSDAWVQQAGPAFTEFINAVNEGVAEGGEALNTIAETASMTSDEFAAVWKEDAGAAFAAFVEGLGIQGENAFKTLGILELGDARLIQAFLALANSGGRLTQSLTIANSAFKPLIDNTGEMNALMLESERRFSTTQSQIDLLKNQWTNLGITLGSFILPIVNDVVAKLRSLIEWFADLSPTIQIATVAFMAFVAAIGPIIVAIGIFAGGLSFIISGIGAVIAAVGSIISTLGLLLIPIGLVAFAFVGLAVVLVSVFVNMAKKTDNFGSTMVQKLAAFGKGMIIAFAKGMLAAVAAVIRALIYIGNIIREWLKPGSPPKLLPDIDVWGARTMDEYMKGWLDADFTIFNQLADIVEKHLRALAPDDDTSLIENIIGTRDIIARIVEQIRTVGKVSKDLIEQLSRRVGGTGSPILEYVRNLEALEKTTREVKKAQDELNRITEKYAGILAPLNAELQQIEDRKSAIRDQERLKELQDILEDEKATATEKELARLEKREIILRQQVKSAERRRDAETSAAQEKLDAAEKQKEQAEAQLAATTQLIAAQQKNNDLLKEQIDLLTRLAEAALDVGGGGGEGIEEPPDLSELGAGGGLGGGFDPNDPLGLGGEGEEGEDPFGFDDLTSGLDQSVQEMTTNIETAINDMVTELTGPFDEVKTLFTELGETWTPIFETLYDYLSVKVPQWIDTISTKFEEFRGKVQEVKTKVTEWFDGVEETISGIVESISSVGIEEGSGLDKFLDFVQAVGEIAWEQIQTGIEEFTTAWDGFRKGLEGIDLTGYENLGKTLEPFMEVLGKVVGFLAGGTVAAAFLPILALIRSVGAAFSWAAEWIGQGIRIIVEGFNIFAQAWADLISGKSNLLDFFNSILEGFGKLGEGVINLVVGAFMFVIGFFEGFVSSVIEFFVGLYERLVGSSIVVDLVEGILFWFAKLLEIPGIVAQWIGDVIGKIAAFVTESSARIAAWVAEQIAKFLEWKDDIVEKALTLKDKVIEFLTNLVTDSLALIVTWVSDMIAKFLELKDDIVGKIEDAAQLIEDAWDALVAWFVSIHQQLFDSIVKPIADAVDEIAGIDLMEIGANLIQGLINGIESLIGSVFATLSGLADNIPQWIKDALGIQSPSKIMFTVGEQIVAGLVGGVDSMAPAMYDSMGNLLDGTRELSRDIANEIGSTASGLRGSIFGKPTYTIGTPAFPSAASTNSSLIEMLAAKYSGTTGRSYQPISYAPQQPATVSRVNNIKIEVNPTYTGHTTPDLLYMDVVSALTASGL